MRKVSILATFLSVALVPLGAQSALALPPLAQEIGTVQGYTGRLGPVGVAFTSDGATAYVTNESSNSVSIINVADNTITGDITDYAGNSPEQIAISPDERYVYVTNWSSGTVSVIDLTQNKQTQLVTGYTGTNPWGVAFTPDGQYAYVTNYSGGTISVIRVSDHTQIATVHNFDVESAPNDVAFTPDGSKAYVTSIGLTNDYIAIIDVTTHTQTGEVACYDQNYPEGVTFSSDGSIAYVANTTSGSVSVINASSHSQVTTIDSVGVYPEFVAFSPDQTTAYVTNYSEGGVAIIRVSDHTQIGTVTGYSGQGGLGIAIAPGGDKAYVANYPGNSVSVLALPLAPTLAPAALATGAAGAAYTSYTFVTTGYPTPTISFALGTNTAATTPGASSVPSGLSLDGATGALTGTIIPTVQPGTYTFTVVATNGIEPEATREYSITVAAAPVPSTPVDPPPSAPQALTTAGGPGHLANTGTEKNTASWYLAGMFIALGTAAALTRVRPIE
ncbi:beta-propeller fold lactonase family protein [Lysinibacter sp. HNR]|uniref:beta-propeller fold lactonase family protein n=1 Tax=Lysinibacter sp. HNR TaxID=3031408 RepID=UPI002434A0A2|nr:beta-propeller fold lactonase family protein [Lysinibacter sp. HNR]WGD37619.1 selenium-binding protein SBP56-related protein [Lysinibacter sp. HNR]